MLKELTNIVPKFPTGPFSELLQVCSVYSFFFISHYIYIQDFDFILTVALNLLVAEKSLPRTEEAIQQEKARLERRKEYTKNYVVNEEREEKEAIDNIRRRYGGGSSGQITTATVFGRFDSQVQHALDVCSRYVIP